MLPRTLITLCLAQIILAIYIDKAPQCNSDDCYRHILHTPTLASVLCTYTGTITSTITPWVTTTVTPVPKVGSAQKRSWVEKQARDIILPQQCAAQSSRVSSACSCLSYETTSVSTTVYAPTATATQTSRPAPPCVANSEIDLRNNQYFTSCDVQITYGVGELITQLSTPDYQSCVAACDMQRGCLGAAYAWSTGICKLSTDGQNAVRTFSPGSWFAAGGYQK